MEAKSIFDELHLYSITKDIAKELFDNGIVIYIQVSDIHFAPETFNTIMLRNDTWDGSLNIYKKGLTPLQYGFKNIIAWAKQREFVSPKFFTYNSTDFITID